jgi:hypothetical protein
MACVLASSASVVGGIERGLLAGAAFAREAERDYLPAWLRPGKGEHRWQMGLAVLTAIGLQLSVPANLAIRPRPVLPILEGALVVALMLASPGRITRRSAAIHTTLPLSRWCKALFLAQSAVSLTTVALVISRAVNIFK